MDISNKEVINKLMKYFLDNEPLIIAKTLACCMIDLHRLKVFDQLPATEKLSLLERLDHNDKELLEFIKNGHRGKLHLENRDS